MSDSKVYVVSLVNCRYDGCDEWGMDEGEYIDSVWDTYEGAVWHIENELKMVKHVPEFNDADRCNFWEGNANEYGSIPEAWITKYPVYTCL